MSSNTKKGKVFVTSQYGNHSTIGDTVEEEIEVGTFGEGVSPASVTVQYGLTLNQGNYESARIDVGVTLPCYREEIDGAVEEAKAIVSRKLSESVKGIKSKLAKAYAGEN